MNQEQPPGNLPGGSGYTSLGSVSNTMPTTANPSPTGDTRRRRGFPSLAALQTVLDQGANSLGPLKAVVNDFADCVGKFEKVSNAKTEYKQLEDELEAIFETLRQHCGESTPPTMTSSIESLCDEIQKELRGIQTKLKRRRLTRIKEASIDPDEVLGCYSRVRDRLRRISLNVNMSMWRVLDISITDNRLKGMMPSLSACYNSAQAVELKRGSCTKGTRIDVLGQLLAWANSSDLGSVYWMSGMAGTGKTTIAYSLCEELDAGRKLAASFFCSRTLPECREINKIVPTIAYQLARVSYPFRHVLSGVLEKDPDIHTRLPHLQFDTLVVQPLLQVEDTLPDNLTVVVDALDECENKESTRLILDVLLTRSSGLPVKSVVCSRPEPEIRDEMEKQSIPARSRVVLHELDKDTVRADIETYLRVALAQVQPDDTQIATLVQRAGVLFIYAATVVRYIGYDNFKRNPRKRLVGILSATNPIKLDRKDRQHIEIDDLYTTILQAAFNDPNLDDTEIEDMRQVLNSVICTYEPLTVNALAKLLGMNDPDQVHAALRPLWSVLHVTGSHNLITTLHASFPDYMLDSSRSNRFYCDGPIHNQNLALRCFDSFRSLRTQFNICHLESSFILDKEVADLKERVESNISEELFYAAQYWATHLFSANGSLSLVQPLEEFLSVRLLLWMEVMNLKQCQGRMPGMMRLVERWGKDSPADLRELIHDAWRFTTTFASSVISESTPHLYTSMLPFWPESSPIIKLYTGRTKGVIKITGTTTNFRQHALLATWPFGGESDGGAWFLGFSPDGTRIAVTTWNRIWLLSASTGQIVLPPFKLDQGSLYEWGDWGSVTKTQFSPDGVWMLLAYNDRPGGHNTAVCLWNIHTGKTKSEKSLGKITSVAFSPDGTRIALGSEDGSTSEWDGDLEQCLSRAFTGGQTRAVKYSHDGCYLIACNNVGSISTWNTRDRQELVTRCHRKEGGEFYSVDISPCCTRVASGSNHSIYIWCAKTGRAVLGPLQVVNVVNHDKIDDRIYVSYSPDGRCIASVRGDTICIWDAQSGNSVIRIPEAHQSVISSIGFSPDGAYV